MTKAAQIHLIKSLATIVSPRIRVNSVAPAILLTVSLSHINVDPATSFSKLTLNIGLGSSVLRRKACGCYGKDATEETANSRGMALLHPQRW